MTNDAMKLRVSFQQMERLLLAIEHVRQNILPRDPALFAAMAEAPLEDRSRIRREIGHHIQALNPVGGA
jgi:hypothetical protein